MKKLFVVLVMLAAMNASGQWVQMSNGMGINKDVFSLTVNGSNIYAGTDSILYISTNNGLSWNETSLNNRTVFAIAINGNNFFAGTRNNGIYHSTNNGMNWNQIFLSGITVIDIKIIGSKIFAATFGSGDGLYVSSDNGLNWSKTSLDSLSLYSLLSFGNYIYAGTYEKGVYMSSNSGINWSQTSLNIESVTKLEYAGNNIFAGSYDGIFLSTNTGVSWTQTSMTSKIVLSLVSYGNNILAGTYSYYYDSGGVFVTSNNGANWIAKNEGFSVIPSARTLLILNGFVFVGTYEHSIWRRPLSDLVNINNISTEISSKYSLSQNYPNPFNPSTKIKFAMPKSGDAKIVVYDVMGREVQTLVNERLQAGTYETSFDGSALTSGVYFYKLITDGFTETKRMLLIK